MTAVIRRSLTETKANGIQFKETKNGKSRTIVLSSSLVEVLALIERCKTMSGASLGPPIKTTISFSRHQPGRRSSRGPSLPLFGT